MPIPPPIPPNPSHSARARNTELFCQIAALEAQICELRCALKVAVEEHHHAHEQLACIMGVRDPALEDADSPIVVNDAAA